MKLTFFLFLLTFSIPGVAQTYVYDAQGNLIQGSHIRLPKGASVTLKDSLTGNRFILDTAHINICALNSKGDTLWITDPWKDNKLPAYRVKRPVIADIDFAKNQWTGNKEVIWIVYINTQFGIIDKKTGKFTWFGQD